jgi:hypothetical protein
MSMSTSSSRLHGFRLSVIAFIFVAVIFTSNSASAQAVPYARTYPKSKDDIAKELKELQAYSGQKLPTVEGFVADQDQPLNHYERAFYQFSIDLLPGQSDDTIVRLTAEITAWYADRDPSKSGYRSLPSNGRLELDLLDRLSEHLGIQPPLDQQAPKFKLDLSTALPAKTLRSDNFPAPAPGHDDVSAIRVKREAEEKRMQELNSQLQALQQIQHTQAHPINLVAVRRSGTPVLSRPMEGSHALFAASAGDEFEFIDAESDWVHVQISRVSRGYIRRSSLDLPDAIAARLKSPNPAASNKVPEPFRIEREETATFPGNWESLRGKRVKIYTIQPVSQDPKETGAQAKLNFASVLFKNFSGEVGGPSSATLVEGVVVVVDSADGGIVAAPLSAVQQFASGSLSREDFWKQCFLDPTDAFTQR